MADQKLSSYALTERSLTLAMDFKRQHGAELVQLALLDRQARAAERQADAMERIADALDGTAAGVDISESLCQGRRPA